MMQAWCGATPDCAFPDVSEVNAELNMLTSRIETASHELMVQVQWCRHGVGQSLAVAPQQTLHRVGPAACT